MHRLSRERYQKGRCIFHSWKVVDGKASGEQEISSFQSIGQTRKMARFKRALVFEIVSEVAWAFGWN